MTKPPAMPEFTRVLVNVQGGESNSTEAQYMGEDIGYMVRVPREWQPAALQSAQPAEVSDAEIRDALEAEFLNEPGKRNLADDMRIARAILALRPQAVPMTPRMVELLAEVVPVENHDDNGPGSVTCPACDAYMHMRWKAGQRIDKIEDLAHDADCPAVWARGMTQRADGGEG